MAHNLSEVDGKVEMFSTGEMPWHSLGQRVPQLATSKEAIAAAHLDWEVEKVPAGALYNGSWITSADKYSLVRKDTQKILSIGQTDRYEIVQNLQAFDFMDELVGKKAAMFETAGALGFGERIWMMAKLPKDVHVAGVDTVKSYLLLVNGHGYGALKIFFTPVRVVCQNTLNAALKGSKSKQSFEMRHTSSIQAKLGHALKTLKFSNLYYEDFEKAANVLAAYKPNKVEVETYYTELLGMNDKKVDEDGNEIEKEPSTRMTNKLNELLNLFEYGKGNDMFKVKHTAWAMYNGATEYADHHSGIRLTDVMDTEESKRFESNMFGGSYNFKQKAMDLALELATV